METQNKNPTVCTGDLYKVAAGCHFFICIESGILSIKLLLSDP